jgi:hypothetical protein
MWIGRQREPKRLFGGCAAMGKSCDGSTARSGASPEAVFQIRGLLPMVRDRARDVRQARDANVGLDWLCQRDGGGRSLQ